MVTDLNGEIALDSEQGVFAGDTRFVSYYSIFANGQSWLRLSASTTKFCAARIHLTNQAFETEEGALEAGSIGLVISRSIGEGIHEDLDVSNFGLVPAQVGPAPV